MPLARGSSALPSVLFLLVLGPFGYMYSLAYISIAFTNCFNDMCLFSLHCLFLFSDFSNSIGTIKNTEQASDIVAIIASVLGVIIFLFIVVLLALIIFGIPCCR